MLRPVCILLFRQPSLTSPLAANEYRQNSCQSRPGTNILRWVKNMVNKFKDNLNNYNNKQ